MKKIITTIMMTALFGATAYSVELFKADFSGTPGAAVSSIPAVDGQLTVHADIINSIFGVLGGTANTTNWQYNAAGDALLNMDLHTAANSGGPTRFDLGLENAAAGQTYTITDIEVEVVATNGTDVSFDLWYDVGSGVSVWANTPSVVIPAGTTGTFTLDTTLDHLIATDSDTKWNLGSKDLRLGFYSSNGTNVDSIGIGEIRVNGTIGAEPAASTDTTWEFNTIGDLEGWSQEWTRDIVGQGVSNAVTGSEVVMTANSIIGNDPNLVRYGRFAPALGFWDTAVIRIRQLDSGGTPVAWDSSGCAVVLGETIVSSSLGGAGWDVLDQAGEWIEATLDISSLTSNELEYIRFDPVGQFAGTNKNFEVDYIHLTSATNGPAGIPDNTFWEFNTDGDLQDWGQAGNGHIIGLDATNGYLSSQSIAGADPQLIGPSVSPADFFWTDLVVRVRQLDSAGTTPEVWNFSGCSVLINGNTQTALGNPIGWDVVTEGGEWIVATLDISSFGSADITSLRIDPVGSAAGTNKNFEVDYIRLNKLAAVPAGAAPSYAWEFDTLGDVEGWAGNGVITDLDVTNGVDGVVLASQAITGGDPQVTQGSLGLTTSSYTWDEAVFRLRQLDPGGSPTNFSTAGTTFVVNGVSITTWDTTSEVGEWIVATVDLAQFGSSTINSLRLDPIGSVAAISKNFEVDYIRLSTRIPPTKTLVDSWEFNTGSVGGLTANNVTGLTATDAVNGSEEVLTSSDLTSGDPQVLLAFDAALSPGGSWDTIEFRFRQLDANPPAGMSQVYATGGTHISVNIGKPGAINFGIIENADPKLTVTTEADGWVSVVADISALGAANLTNFRLDPVGTDAAKNFEIDWIRVYADQDTVGYDAWTFVNGLSGDLADSTADPDQDLYNNFYEYAFGGNPIDEADMGYLPTASVVNVGSNVLEFISYERSDVASGVDYALDSTINLVSTPMAEFTDYTVEGTGVVDADMNAVTNHIPATVDARFIQSKATAQ